MELKICPCRKTADTPLPYAECCQPYVEGKAQAPTAEALMRSRYSAFAVGNIDYLVETVVPDQRHDMDRGALQAWSKESSWDGLDIVDTVDGKDSDSTGTVEFVAHFTRERKREAHHERSTFRKENGSWYFVEGGKPKGTPVVKSVSVGRNDPCPCGSGKKFKKCCGA